MPRTLALPLVKCVGKSLPARSSWRARGEGQLEGEATPRKVPQIAGERRSAGSSGFPQGRQCVASPCLVQSQEAIGRVQYGGSGQGVDGGAEEHPGAVLLGAEQQPLVLVLAPGWVRPAATGGVRYLGG